MYSAYQSSSIAQQVIKPDRIEVAVVWPGQRPGRLILSLNRHQKTVGEFTPGQASAAWVRIKNHLALVTNDSMPLSSRSRTIPHDYVVTPIPDEIITHVSGQGNVKEEKSSCGKPFIDNLSPVAAFPTREMDNFLNRNLKESGKTGGETISSAKVENSLICFLQNNLRAVRFNQSIKAENQGRCSVDIPCNKQRGVICKTALEAPVFGLFRRWPYE
jgi:hypothetical protein